MCVRTRAQNKNRNIRNGRTTRIRIVLSDVTPSTHASRRRAHRRDGAQSPAGVGFSTVKNATGRATNDQVAAADVYAFLEGWFTEFPQFAAHDLYLLGESYGGH